MEQEISTITLAIFAIAMASVIVPISSIAILKAIPNGQG